MSFNFFKSKIIIVLYAHLAENIPGAPSRLSMHMPLSSAMLGNNAMLILMQTLLLLEHYP